MLAADPGLTPGRGSLAAANESRLRRGFPVGTPKWQLLAGAPRDLMLTLRYLMGTRSLDRAWRLSKMLAKARIFRVHPQIWVLDQGLNQHILTDLAEGRLSADAARSWCTRLRAPPYGAAELVAVTVISEMLRAQIEGSEKHLKQAGMRGAEVYALQMEAAFKLLTAEADK